MTDVRELTLPIYQGQEWLTMPLPYAHQDWITGNRHNVRKRKSAYPRARKAVEDLVEAVHWQWPRQEVVFISDVHADADALLASLVASGGIRKTGGADEDFELTDKGRAAVFVFGGDFFDKGPSNLRVLDVLKSFMLSGAIVKLLAGNHDIRVLYGMRAAGNTCDPRNGHFFIRMGAKGIPFLKEIRDRYLSQPENLDEYPSEEECAQLLLPQQAWWDEFPKLASWVMNQAAIDREMRKIEKKSSKFAEHCAKAGITLREAYAASCQWRKLFLVPDGDYAWFYDHLQLAHRMGSFLFVHAGLDDRVASMLREHGISFINNLFKQQLHGNPFEFYYGPLANTIRTKYRTVDMPLTRFGQQDAWQAGIHAVIHGHRNLHRGQRIALRKKILHFECDITLDQHSRAKEGLTGIGAGATLIHPAGYIVGISNDHDHVKVFQPRHSQRALA